MIPEIKTTKKDFKVKEPVKWCSGCGTYSVLAAVTNALPETGVKKEDVVFVSGIGCSSRFPYYVNTYGFHGLHGRGSAIASGVKIANPNLSVWQITGDGDCMAIGGNHFIHILRRNLNINILLLNNQIYGLTKGQYSPTTPKGSVTKTSPDGTIEDPFKPGELAMGAEGTFFARVVDTEPKIIKDVILEASKHKGTSLVEILENCIIFANKTHENITGKEVRKDNQIYLRHGKPMLFGADNKKGLILDGLKLKVVEIGKNGIKKKDILVHDAKISDPTLHYMLARMTLPEHPVAMGVIRASKSSVFESLLHDQINIAKKETDIKNCDDLFNQGNVFEND